MKLLTLLLCDEEKMPLKAVDTLVKNLTHDSLSLRKVSYSGLKVIKDQQD